MERVGKPTPLSTARFPSAVTERPLPNAVSFPFCRANYRQEVIETGKRKKESNPRLDPEERIAPLYDSTGIRKFPVAKPGETGFRVLDDCAEEHMQ